jgi:hypothetical protein
MIILSFGGAVALTLQAGFKRLNTRLSSVYWTETASLFSQIGYTGC